MYSLKLGRRIASPSHLLVNYHMLVIWVILALNACHYAFTERTHNNFSAKLYAGKEPLSILEEMSWCRHACNINRPILNDNLNENGNGYNNNNNFKNS